MPLAALADGKVFPPVAIPANVTIPDQRALIHFTNGIERLVIETRFTGEGTNFAWVIPLPSQPVIEEATTGLFPTLQHLFQLRILYNLPRYYIGFLALTGIIYLLFFVRPTGRLEWFDVGACILVGLSAALGVPEREAYFWAKLLVFLLVLCPFLGAVVFIRVYKRPAGVVFAGLALYLYLLVLFAPPSIKAAAVQIPEGPAVSILERRLVGIFETTTIATDDPGALRAWLEQNGFFVPTNAVPVVERYVKDGWVFVATKVRRDDPKLDTSTPHPLSFTFKTDRPVYPLRLTGVDNGPVTVELYVFGPGRAKAKHFKVERCAKPDYPHLLPQGSAWGAWVPERPTIVHPLLRKWVTEAPVVTKLTATLTPAQMQDDVWLTWTAFKERKNRLYSRGGASTVALNWGAGLAALGMLGIQVLRFGPSIRRPRRGRVLELVPLLTGAVVGCVIYFALPKTEVRLVRRPASLARQAMLELYIELSDATPGSLVEARKAARDVLERPGEWVTFVKVAKSYGGTGWDNFISGGQIREEDSPGNFTLRQKDGLIEFVAYDALGAEHVMGPVGSAGPN